MRIVKLAVIAALSAVFGFIAHSAEDSAKVGWMLQTNLLENSSAEAAKDLPKVLRARGRNVEDHVESPRILAHRGSRGEYQDNAAGGFTKCLNAGVTGFEVDIRMTKDGHLVVMHDAKLERTTDGKGVIEELTLAEIKKCKLVNCSEAVPTIEEVLRRLNGRDDIFIELEMKAAADTKNGRLEEYCRKLNEVARRQLKPGTFAFTSFDEDYLAAMKRVDPSARTGLIRGRPIAEDFINRALELGCSQIAPLLKGSTKELVDLAHAKGLKVTLWMVQNRADYLAAKALGADATTSDYPILLRQRVRGGEKKLIALDLDAMLCRHRSAIPPANLAALKKLQERYRCIMVGAGNAPRIYKQMGNHPIEIVGNDATLDWAKRHGYELDDIVFIGDDFADGGGDSHVRTKDSPKLGGYQRMDYIVINDYRKFHEAVSVLLK